MIINEKGEKGYTIIRGWQDEVRWGEVKRGEVRLGDDYRIKNIKHYQALSKVPRPTNAFGQTRWKRTSHALMSTRVNSD